jgi:hypothetical protein
MASEVRITNLTLSLTGSGGTVIDNSKYKFLIWSASDTNLTILIWSASDTNLTQISTGRRQLWYWIHTEHERLILIHRNRITYLYLFMPCMCLLYSQNLHETVILSYHLQTNIHAFTRTYICIHKDTQLYTHPSGGRAVFGRLLCARRRCGGECERGCTAHGKVML